VAEEILSRKGAVDDHVLDWYADSVCTISDLSERFLEV